MKFTVAVVLLGLAAGIESYALPWASAVVPVEGSYIAKTHGAVHVAPLSGHATQLGNSAAAINLQPAPGTVPADGLHAEAEYVAKTQGAVHVAPLPGHAKSVIADNDRAAPGTTGEWVAPAVVPAYVPGAVHAPVVAPVAQAEGEYVAKTQGAVHVAPLAGHAKSVASINVAAAPGTSHGWVAPVAPVVPYFAPIAHVAAPAYTPAVSYSSIAAHPAVVAHAPVHVPTVEGSYVAQTRGAVHVAPLVGHVHSAASINLQPAPGTVY